MASLEAVEDRRLSSRTKVLKVAKIVSRGASTVIDCVVQDLSSSGACIQVENLPDASSSFDMSFDGFRSIRACRVVWRKSGKLGLAFEQAGASLRHA
jgi:hypothetical protein